MLCLVALGPGTRQKPLQLSILDWVCGGQAGCARQTAEAAHPGFRSNCCSERVAALPALLAPSPRPQARPAGCRASNHSRVPQPLAFFLWRHRKCHLLLLRKITAFGWI